MSEAGEKRGPTPLDVLRRLERSNCRECGQQTCMAFAAAVVQGRMRIDECPRLGEGVAEELGRVIGGGVAAGVERREEAIESMKAVVRGIDLEGAAERTGGRFEAGRLVLRCLGKIFELDGSGNLHSECHVNPWVHLPILTYVARCRGLELAGEWMPMARLEGGKDWDRFFAHRCEDAVRRIADLDPDLFFDTLDMFDGAPIEKGTAGISDSAQEQVALHLMPRLPMIVAYCRPEEAALPSSLTLLFDASAAGNMGAEGIFRVCTGLVEMLRKIMLRHGLATG